MQVHAGKSLIWLWSVHGSFLDVLEWSWIWVAPKTVTKLGYVPIFGLFHLCRHQMRRRRGAAMPVSSSFDTQEAALLV